MKKLFLFLVVFFSFLSVSAGWGDDLCEDVTCSGHGECQEDGEDEWCVCDEGYIADGLDCILGCNGVTCSGHGVCSVVSGAEVCTCEAGFHASGLNCILNEASTVDTLAILNETACYNTGNCHYRLIFATGAYSFNPSIASLYDIIVNVLDSENVWHNYRRTVAQCVTEGVCDNVDAQYVDFWFQHEVDGNQYITVEVLGNGDDASDDMYHDVLIDYCYGVDCGTGGSCDDSLGYPVCSCEYGYVLRNGYCEEGWFGDINLAAAVVELLKHEGYEVESETDIDPEMLAGIESLSLRHKNISSLAGIELFSSLSVLDISENHISDLTPLANCENLAVLNMSGNPAGDLSPLSALPLTSIDVSYSGVYNFNPLVSAGTLYELIFADTVNGRHGMTRPDNTAVNVWLGSLLGCNDLVIIYGSAGGTYKTGVVGIGGGCPAHGSCVEGICRCDEGYVFSEKSNACFNPESCGSGYHPDVVTGTCDSNIAKYDCGDLPEHSKIVQNSNNIIWNGSGYVIPAGRTTELCRSGDTECQESICQWECQSGYLWVKDDICVSNNAERFIQNGEFNRLILPNISRQDVSLEPVPGVPSFAPVLTAGIYYNAKKDLKAGWHLDLPRAELNTSPVSWMIIPHHFWDLNTVYLYMPWGKEEYSMVAEKKCFDSNNEEVLPCKYPGDLSAADHVEITYYPAPGQNLFSYVVLKTRGEACKISYSDSDGKYFDGAGKGKDTWEITRYGDDGSVTEFYRGLISGFNVPQVPDPVPRNIPSDLLEYASRPALSSFMDYIPISRHTTRDKKVTLFKYDWERVEDYDGEFLYYVIRSANIIDPLKRIIRIESDSDGKSLLGRYELGYKPLEGDITVSVGKAGSDNNPQEPLKRIVRYLGFNGFSMNAAIYKDENIYRRDKYYIENGIFYLKSHVYDLQMPDYDGNLLGKTSWEFTREDGEPSGYIEKKLINGLPEYAVKRVKGAFSKSTQLTYGGLYSLSLPADENHRHKTTTVYSHERNGMPGSKRIVADYYTNWLQPAERVTCERGQNEADNCDNAANAVREEIKYNVSGSPIYFKNAGGQVTVNLYNTTNELSPGNYMQHYLKDPLNYSNTWNVSNLPALDFIRADYLYKSGTPACSSVYSLDADSDDIDDMLREYIGYGVSYNSGWCSNSSDHRVTNYEWQRDEEWGKPYDLKTVTYPDGKTKTLTYDYETTNQNGYIPNGKVRGETVTGSSNQNTLQTCYEYNSNYQLEKQGIGAAGSCNLKKGFEFSGEGGLLMTQDYSFDENLRPVLKNDYIYDYLGRKIVERNSAGISTLYVYDSLDRVVFTFFGCNIEPNSFGTRVYAPYNFEGDASAGEDGRGVASSYTSGEFPYARYINLTTCEYYRKYKYDEVSNLVETDFFEYWNISTDNQVEPLAAPKIIKQTTEYDLLGRAVKSCQYDGAISKPTDYDKRCIETEHDIFGNIVKKTENGEIREITYDLRNRPLTVTVDGLTTEQYSYSSSTSGGYFGYDSIRNKYENILPLTTYKDKWGRAAKSVDPFGNETETTYESDYSDNITSQITKTSSDVKTGETAWTYDDLDRKLSETRKQFIPGSESTTNVNHVTWWEYDTIGNVISVESSDGTKQTYSYDTLNRPVETINYEKINSNWVETSSSENSYDSVTGRLSSTETTRNNQTITEDYGFDTFGRVTSIKTTDPENSSRYRLKFYNTGGQVIWETDEESDSDPRNLEDLGFWHVEVGNEKYYTYNAFGDLEKTVYIMTNNGKGLASIDLNPWLNDSQITTNFAYDIFGRITSRTNDRSGVTEYNYYDTNAASSHRRNKLESIQITPALTDNDTGYQDSDSSTQTYTYTYDDKGDEASVEYTEGNSYSMEVAFTRDAYGRITGKTSNGSVPVTQTFTYNNRNLLETATDTVGNAAATSVTRYYDSFGNPYSEAVSANNVTKTVSRMMTDAKTYQFTYPDGKILRKTVTGNDLDSIEYGTTGNLAELASYSRANGVLTAITKGQNLIETFSYNNWNMLDNHTVSNANADVYDMTYNYSRGWHLIEKADGIKNTSDKYSYDSYYRLKEVKYDFANNTAARTDSFFADGVHNIEQSTENGVTYAWGVDKLNRLRDKKVGGNTAVTYKYDKRNNMIGEDFDGSNPVDISYIYDDLNRLIEVKDGSNQTIATYTYDAFNRRITKTIGNTTERYSYDDWNIVEIATNSNDYTNIIDSGMDRHIAIEVTTNNTSTLYYFLTDERGNVTALTDANGNVLERYRYRVYGDFEILDSQFIPKNCNNQTCYATNLHNFLWGGSLYEPETNLYWMRNRYYHIDMHRFINQDPIGIWGDANNLGNGFAYVAGMVIEASDPTGLAEITGITGDKALPYFVEKNWETQGHEPSPMLLEQSKALAEQGFLLYGNYGMGPRSDVIDLINNFVRLVIVTYNEMKKRINAMDHEKYRFKDDDVIYQQTFKDKDGKFLGEIIIRADRSFTLNYKDKNGTGIEIDFNSQGIRVEKREYKNKRLIKKWKWQVVGKDGKGNDIYDWVEVPIDSMPSDPYSDNDAKQNFVRDQFLKKILEMHEKKSFFETMNEVGPVIKYDDDGRKVFIFNPYYKGKDPLKEIIWEKQKADGTKGFVRNPFAPGAEYGYDATTYEKWQNKGFIQPNVDPYFE